MSGRPRPVVIAGDPVLHTPSATVTRFDAELATLIDDMFATMYLAEGVGLAAPQIGVGLRVFVYDCHDDEGRFAKGHVVNPVLSRLSEELLDFDEGCLSVPGPYAPLVRPRSATVNGVNCDNEPIEVSGTGFLARCLIHETEHLSGTLYIDHLTRRRRSRVLREIEPFPWNAPLPFAADS
jgi:peptide deformylase